MEEGYPVSPTFEEQMMNQVKNSMMSQISKTDFLKLDYNGRKVIPKDFLDKVWSSVDWDEVIKNMKTQIQDHICNVAVQSMLTEIKTDIKSILSIDGVRKKIRAEAYPKIMKALDDCGVEVK